MLCRWIVALAAVWTTLFAAEEATARQVALVAGNARYAVLPGLRNPRNDAAAIADRLRDFGFDVVEVFDADTFALNRAAERFLDSARGADLALFYFAGHGVQLFDRNVLLASDANPATAANIRELGLDLSDFMRRLRAAGPVRSTLMVDACRDNALTFDQTVNLLRRLTPPAGTSAATGAPPAAGTRGLARTDLPPAGSGQGETMLFFAAQPGRVSYDGDGQNSYFVEGLKEAMAQADRPLSQVFQQASSYVRTVTRGDQVPQIVSDWTGDIVLGRTAVPIVRYLNARSAVGDRELTPQEAAIVGASYRTYQELQGTFVAHASQSFISDFRNADEAERAKADKIGSINGFAIDYDLDRDGRDETIGAYVMQVNVVVEVVDEGFRTLATPCFGEKSDEKGVETMEIALRDLNGDRRPEIFMKLKEGDDPWGTFCILEYRGTPSLADARRGAQGFTYDDGSIFRVLLRETVMQVRVGEDNSISTCSGSNCHTRSRWRFDGERFTMLEDESEEPKGARAKPFRDEDERRALGAVRDPETNAVPGDAAPPAANPPASLASPRDRIEAYITQTYLPDGQGGRIVTTFTDPVLYYGESKTRAAVLADKHGYYAKWPRRQFELVPGTLVVTPAGTGAYDVAFEYTFVAENAKKRSEGRGRTRLTLRELQGGFVIAREDGETIKGR